MKAVDINIRLELSGITVFVLIALVFLHCEYRSRSNPLDPDNQTTGGKPTGLSVSSRMDTVILTWPKLDFENLTAFVVYRSDSLNGKYMQIEHVPAATRKFQDIGLVYEKTYWYRISALSNGYESKLSDAVSITPGPTFSWVLERGTGSIIKLSHDCQHVVFHTSYNGYPDKITVNPLDGTAWVFDDFMNQIYHLDANGNLLKKLENYDQILDLAADPQTGGLWLVDGRNSQILRLNFAGRLIQRYQNLQRPTCLTVASKTGNCWFVDSDAGKIFVFESDGNVKQKVDFPFLGVSKIEIHEATGTLWLADSLRLLQVQENQVKQAAAIQPRDLVIDQTDGSCWVAERSGISKYAPNGVLKFTQSGYFYDPTIAVNQFTQSCLVSERLSEQLLQISRYGTEVTSLNTVQFPSAVAVEYRLSN